MDFLGFAELATWFQKLNDDLGIGNVTWVIIGLWAAALIAINFSEICHFIVRRKNKGKEETFGNILENPSEAVHEKNNDAISKKPNTTTTVQIRLVDGSPGIIGESKEY